MNSPSSCVLGSPAPAASPHPATRYLARQPILDTRGHVVAYELLFRSGTSSTFDGLGDLASRIMIDNMMLYGGARLTAGLPAFINCTEDTLFSEYIQMLPVPLTVLEVLEDVEASEAVVRSCLGLRQKGYRIALDDFQYRPSLGPLIRIADIIKVDFRSTPASERRSLISTLREFQGLYLAEKVETREEYEKALEEGFTLFQGYYFCKPFLLKKRVVPSNRLVHLRLLSLLQENPLDIDEISELLKSEPSLAYRLLRYVNSAARGMAKEISSIKTALFVAGDDQFRRMATLAAAVELNAGPSPEILRMALVRARFCEAAARLWRLDPTEQYLVGLFSLLDAMLQMPMEEALAPLSLAAPIRTALLESDGSYNCPLRWLEHHERGDFSGCDDFAQAYGIVPDLLEQHLNGAMLWSDELLDQK